jgi:hypothetical protein
MGSGSTGGVGFGATSGARAGGGPALTISTVSGPVVTIVIGSSVRFRIGIMMSTMCTSSEMPTQRMNLREYEATGRLGIYFRRRMITLPDTDTAMPAQVSADQ